MPISTSSSWSQLLPMDTSSPHHVSMGLGPKVTQRDRVEKISKMGSRKGFVLTHLLIEIAFVTMDRNQGKLDICVYLLVRFSG